MTDPIAAPEMPNDGLIADGKLTDAGFNHIEQLTKAVKDISDVLGTGDDEGPALGELASKDTIERTDLASGFGSIIIQRVVVASTAAVVACTTVVPYDDTIPQSTEGDQVLSGTFTPLSDASVLEIEARLMGGATTTVKLGIGLFQDSGTDAIAASWGISFSASANQQFLLHRMASPGTSAITFSVRAGPAAAATYGLNTSDATNRIGGGSVLSQLIVTELQGY